VKAQDEFDGHQLTKRFGMKPALEQEMALPRTYDAETEKMRASHGRSGSVVKKIWCRRWVPPLTQEFFCSDCEQMLPRAKFAQAQLSKHKSDEDRLCKECAHLTMQKVEAVRVGEDYEAEEIEDKLKSKRAANRAGCGSTSATASTSTSASTSISAGTSTSAGEAVGSHGP